MTLARVASEPRLLSSRGTWFYKVAVPGLVALAALAALPVLFGEESRETLGPLALLLAVVVCAIAALTAWMLVPLKQVRLEGEDLLVSNFRDEVRVPLRDVVRVEASRFTNPERIRLHLRFETPFGSRIAFLPPVRWVRVFTPHPLAEQLRARIAGGALEIPPDLRRLSPAWIVALLLAGVVGLNALVFGALRSHAAYRSAVAIARADARLVAALGEPIEEGWLVSGTMQGFGEGGSANLAFSLSGPNAAARVVLRAHKSAGQWRHDVLVARIESGEEIDLLAPSAR